MSITGPMGCITLRMTAPAQLSGLRSAKFVMNRPARHNGKPLAAGLFGPSPAYVRESLRIPLDQGAGWPADLAVAAHQGRPIRSTSARSRPAPSSPTRCCRASDCSCSRPAPGWPPFMSLVRDPEVYGMFEEVIVVHSVRNVAELAYRELLESKLEGDPLLEDEDRARMIYVPTRHPRAVPHTGAAFRR